MTWQGSPHPLTFRLPCGKVVLEPKKAGGVEGLAAMAEELVEALRVE